LTSSRRPGLGLLLLIALCLTSACSTTTKGKKHSKDGLTLSVIKKTMLGSEVNKRRFNHPVRISETSIQSHLLSLKYEGLTLMSKKKWVFKKESVVKISPWLTKILHRINPQQAVHLEFETAKGSTIADVFAVGKTMHWHFTAIKGVDFSHSSRPGWGSSWQLLPQTGQRYHTTKKLLGTKTWVNWIVANQKLPRAIRRINNKGPLIADRPRKQKPSPPPRRSSAKKPDDGDRGKTPGLEKKLQFLKNLYDKELIDEQEYQRKKKDLMDEFF